MIHFETIHLVEGGAMDGQMKRNWPSVNNWGRGRYTWVKFIIHCAP